MLILPFIVVKQTRHRSGGQALIRELLVGRPEQLMHARLEECRRGVVAQFDHALWLQLVDDQRHAHAVVERMHLVNAVRASLILSL